MPARIFISYRTSDGVDKATALGRELGKIFGDAAVFLDKDDLRGGSAWRDEIARTLDGKPVLLLLLTPQLLAAVDATGQARIAAADDPVRRELEVALAAGARVIPLLCDGLAGPPDAAHLPAPFDCLAELTWRQLRAYDWAQDIERLVGDLEALGVPRIAAAGDPAAKASGAAAPAGAGPARRWWAGGLVALLAIALALWLAAQPDTPAGLTGRWQARLWQGEQVVLVLSEQAGVVTLASEPVPIARRPDWVEYRRFWRERTGADLDAVMYRGAGKRIDDPGLPPAIDIALQVLPSPGGSEPVDSGNLSARLAADGRTLTGQIWLNGAQAEQPATLTRLP
jgi:hypothetical protein